MRVSAGFFVTGLSGNTLIQTLPPRLMWRVNATREASICRLVSQHGSSACKPYSPNVSVLPTIARPRIRPRCTLRCLTRFGVSITVAPQRLEFRLAALPLARALQLARPARVLRLAQLAQALRFGRQVREPVLRVLAL